jgi:acetylornithine deacetylase/succinyl-diaminopimelate desuccinylase-like protein
MMVDARGVDGASLDLVEHRIRDAVARIAAARGVGSTVTGLRGGDPVTLDRSLALAALRAAQRRGIPAEPTWSGAGHDVQHVAARVASLLLFVPLRGGESHTPAEGADAAEIAAAALIARDVLNER